MKKLLIPVIMLIAAVMTLSIYTAMYDTEPDAVALVQPADAQSIDTSSADYYTADRQEYPVGANADNQYDILADNQLYGHDDYNDYTEAKVRYVDGYPVVNGEKTYSKYYATDGYIQPAEEDKPWEEWNMHDFHANGEFFDTFGNGTMSFYNKEDMEAFAEEMRNEYGAENIREVKLDTNASTDNIVDKLPEAQEAVDETNEQTADLENQADSMK